MNKETQIALKNYDYLVRNRGLHDVTLHWESDTIVYGSGGVTLETLCEVGFTPATVIEEKDKSAYERIEALMRSHFAGLTVSEVQDKLLDVERNTIDVSLKRLQESGVIYRVTRGFYRPYEDE